MHSAVVFYVVALIGAVLGFGGMATSAAGIAKVLFFAFLVMAALGFVVGLLMR